MVTGLMVVEGFVMERGLYRGLGDSTSLASGTIIGDKVCENQSYWRRILSRQDVK